MRRKAGTICMVLGTILIIAALSLFCWNQWEAHNAEESAGKILPLVKEQLKDNDPSDSDPYDPTMKEIEINGYYYIGYLSIPSLNLELPVMSDLDYAKLKISPCRYCGSTKTDNLVIAAHNYIRHFGALSKISLGDKVYFTDMDGILTQYEVADIEVLLPTEVEKMSNSSYALTLFTCTYGGKSRMTIRCNRVKD